MQAYMGVMHMVSLFCAIFGCYRAHVTRKIKLRSHSSATTAALAQQEMSTIVLKVKINGVGFLLAWVHLASYAGI